MELNRETVSTAVGRVILEAAGEMEPQTVREMGMGLLLYDVTVDRVQYGKTHVGMDLGYGDAYVKGQQITAGLISCVKQSITEVPPPGQYLKIPYTFPAGHQAWVVRTASSIAVFAGSKLGDVPLNAALVLASCVDNMELYTAAMKQSERTLAHLDARATRAIKLMDLIPHGEVEVHWALSSVPFIFGQSAAAQLRAPRWAGAS
jgi:hypothetical protein